MKKSLFTLAFAFLLVSTTNMLFAQKNANVAKEIEMFPAPKHGFKQVFIKVPAKKNEANYKIEILVGITQMVNCNRHFMGGTIEEKNLDGWGYTYYVAETSGNVGSTMMACPDGKLTKQFIHLQPMTVNYNSRLPIVVYVPKDLEVKYTIWSAGKKMFSAQNGFKPAEAEVAETKVENKRWKLVQLNGKKIEGSADTHYLVLHSDKSRAEAKAGCNNLNLGYELKNEFQIKFSKGMSTIMACPDGNVEQEYLKVLTKVDNLTTDGKTLSLNKARMAPLAIFELVE